LWDPLENHKDVRIESFDMEYVARKYDYATRIQINGKYPDVILDDVYDSENYVENIRRLVQLYPVSRISAKFLSEQMKINKVESVVEEQFYYYGGERRILYRVPRFAQNFIPPIFHQCARCCYYSRCITMIGEPDQNLEKYWIILFGVVGHHCEAYPGIRNIKLVEELRNEFLRGRPIREAVKIITQESALPGHRERTEETVSRVAGMMINMKDPIVKENYYENPIGLISKSLEVAEIVEKLILIPHELNIVKGNIDFDRYMRIYHLYAHCNRNKMKYPFKCVLNRTYIEDTSDVMYCEINKEVDYQSYNEFIKLGDSVILISRKYENLKGWLLDKGGTKQY